MKKTLCIILLILAVVITLAACGRVTVTWRDGDGSILYSEQIEKDAPIPQKPLPDDNDEWDYIEWKSETADGKNISYTASREAKDRYEWRDTDGALLHKESLKSGSPAPVFELPKDTTAFDYTEWAKSIEGGVTVYTASGHAGKTLYYKDVDGTVLYTVFVREGEGAPERYLPNDTVDWHYTEWKETGDGFVAVRVPKEKIHWLDVDGKELYLDGILAGEELKMREFPKDSKKWIYKEWADVTEPGGEKTFMAIADMNPKYFVGNVFQIVSKVIYGNPFGIGSGFVFNQSGWFVTNYHVIENAVSADAIFEIENFSTGDSYTTLEISHAFYSSPEKDIFIGRIENYKSISSHYQNIPLVREYKVGDTVYSVGYPSASIKMEIHEGEIVDESEKKVNSLYEKLRGGSTYIPNTAYIAPGSSGGILVNEKLEVIGVTAGGLEEKNKFVLGAAIRTFNFQSMANSVSVSKAKDFVEFFYPLNADAIKFFRMGEKHENCIGLVRDYSGTYYQYIYAENFDKGENATVINVYDTGLVVYTHTYAWNDGDICTNVLTGYYTGDSSCINNFEYVFVYAWPSGGGYTITSSDINYSKDVNLTLKEYDLQEKGNSVIDEDNIKYAKGHFNETYEGLLEFLKSAE